VPNFLPLKPPLSKTARTRNRRRYSVAPLREREIALRRLHRLVMAIRETFEAIKTALGKNRAGIARDWIDRLDGFLFP